MKMEDMVLISVDDHITEPAEVFDNQLSGEAYATAPKLRERDNGANYWEYQGAQIDMARGLTLKALQGYAGDMLTDEALGKIDADLAKLPAKH